MHIVLGEGEMLWAGGALFTLEVLKLDNRLRVSFPNLSDLDGQVDRY